MGVQIALGEPGLSSAKSRGGPRLIDAKSASPSVKTENGQ